MPLGFPVLPDVYSMNRVSSLSMGTGSQLVLSASMACNHTAGAQLSIQDDDDVGLNVLGCWADFFMLLNIHGGEMAY